MLQQFYISQFKKLCISITMIICISYVVSAELYTILSKAPSAIVSSFEDTVRLPIFGPQLIDPYSIAPDSKTSLTTPNSNSTSGSYISTVPSSVSESTILDSEISCTSLLNTDTTTTGTDTAPTSASSDSALIYHTSKNINADLSDGSVSSIISSAVTSQSPISTSASSNSVNKKIDSPISIPITTSTNLEKVDSTLNISRYVTTGDSFPSISSSSQTSDIFESSNIFATSDSFATSDNYSLKSQGFILPINITTSRSKDIDTSNTDNVPTNSSIFPVTSTLLTIPSAISDTDSTSVPHLKDDMPVNVFASAALSVPSIQKYLNYHISGPEASTVLFNAVFDVLVSLDIPSAVTDAAEISQAASTNDVLTLPMYFEAVGNVIVNFLVTNKTKISPELPKSYAIIIEKSISSTNIADVEALHKVLLKSFIYFISSLGFDVSKVVDDLIYFLSYELRALSIH